MARLSLTIFSIVSALLTSHVGAAPVRHVARQKVTQTADDFQQLAYADFQISDGVGGQAQEEANAVFVDPFNSTDLTTVSSDVLDAMNAMREAAESAETDDFDPQIDAASGSDADALQVGKIKNKVLKLTGEVQVLNIKIAQAQANGDDTSDLESDLADEQTKLSTNIATDQASAGATSQSITDSSLRLKKRGLPYSTDKRAHRMRRAATETADNFQVLDYADFQISDGVGGTAQQEANAIFVDPFSNTDLTTVSSDTLDAMNTMREAAESAETDDFDPQIDAASGATADALSVGKTKNKVLKLTAEVQALNIKIAQAQASGDDTSDLESSLADEQAKLTTNLAADADNAGKTSQGVA